MRACLVLLVLYLVVPAVASAGGAACVMAKHQGQTLDYALVVGAGHPSEAQDAAIRELRSKGYGDYGPKLDLIRAQNLTNLDQAYVLVIRADFEDLRGRPRSAMGCGFSAVSYAEAEWDAIRDLQAHFWGWKPDQHGYEVVRRLRY